MENKVLVSVVVAVYNAEAYLKECSDIELKGAYYSIFTNLVERVKK